MLYFLTALPTEAGMASASGREFRKTNFPICVIPWAVVDVPMMGTPLALASGPTTFISVLSVGPRSATTRPLRVPRAPFFFPRVPFPPRKTGGDRDREDQTGQPDLPVHGAPLDMV